MREPGAAVGDYRRVSFWMDSLDEPLGARPGLPGDLDCDVAIVGGGYTGLWTAYYLAEADPSLSVAVLEREIVGYGASGRNGGWCSAFFAASHHRIAEEHGIDAMHAMRRAMNETVDEVGRVAAAEGIDCHFRKGGSIHAARSAAQLAAVEAELEAARALGIGEEDLRRCGGAEARALLPATEVTDALFTPHCAAIHPARLARGLGEAVERRGVRLYESTEVLEVVPGGPRGARPVVLTRRGRVRAGAVVLATEGYTAHLPGRRREVVPIYSLMVATEPLGDRALADLGEALAGGLTFTDGRHLLIYGQLTTDGRLAFGGRGAPYHFASAISDRFDADTTVHAALALTLAELFPSLGPIRLSHRWGGPIGIHRDWHPAVRFDRRAGIASAGGYVGDGVSTTNLAGRTLADLLTGDESDLVSLPWVGHVSRRWEPEPLRFLGVNTILKVMEAADRREEVTGRPSRLASVLERVTG